MSQVSTEQLLGYAVSASPANALVASIADWIRHGDRLRWLACINPHSYAVAAGAPAFATALKEADWLVPDGAGIVLGSRILGGNIRERVTGMDVFLGLSRALDAGGGARVFFLGSTEETLGQIREKLAVDFPRLTVAGTYSPPFKPEYSEQDVDAMLEVINAARPDVVWVGLTSPKQDLWLHRVRGRLDARFAAGVGAVFDFYVGRIKRSPEVFQRLGLEWLPRLLQEPRRLWRRTFVSAPIFLRDVARERVRSARG